MGQAPYKEGVADLFGVDWPGVPSNERCQQCGQPDNCGDCNHSRLPDDQVELLGGKRKLKL